MGQDQQSSKKEFNSMPVHDDKFIKTKDKNLQ